MKSYPEHVVDHYGPDVRVVSRRFPGRIGADIVVQTRHKGGWRDHRVYDEVADDFAYTNAQRCASALAKELR